MRGLFGSGRYIGLFVDLHLLRWYFHILRISKNNLYPNSTWIALRDVIGAKQATWVEYTVVQASTFIVFLMQKMKLFFHINCLCSTAFCEAIYPFDHAIIFVVCVLIYLHTYTHTHTTWERQRQTRDRLRQNSFTFCPLCLTKDKKNISGLVGEKVRFHTQLLYSFNAYCTLKEKNTYMTQI